AIPVFAPGCSSDDSTTTPDASASTGSPDADVCGDPNLASPGGSCYPVANIRCFPICATGGCWCRSGGSIPDAGVWQCQSDVSCFPDSSPIDDFDSSEPVDDSGDIDSGDDSGDDASDAGLDADAS
ncbi:MAG: hypothetical protein ACRELY_29520, partial [Polyangiaceae bacterium]